jgi:chromosomal replication initiation ATPase DnaA
MWRMGRVGPIFILQRTLKFISSTLRTNVQSMMTTIMKIKELVLMKKTEPRQELSQEILEKLDKMKKKL